MLDPESKSLQTKSLKRRIRVNISEQHLKWNGKDEDDLDRRSQVMKVENRVIYDMGHPDSGIKSQGKRRKVRSKLESV